MDYLDLCQQRIVTIGRRKDAHAGGWTPFRRVFARLMEPTGRSPPAIRR